MTLPPLTDWMTTCHGLHTVAQVMGRVRKSFIAPQPNALHLTLRVTSHGLTTGPFTTTSGTHTINADFTTQQIHASFAVDSFPMTQPGLNALISAAEAEAENGLREGETLPEVTIDAGHAADYARAQYAVFTALARFRARLGGRITPLALWPHHFDQSFLYFISGEGDEHSDPHLNFGFAPYSDTITRPYLYMYAWPMPEGITAQPLPTPAEWVTDDWTGVMIPYDKLVEDADPQATIEAVCAAVFDVFVQHMDGA